MTLLSDIVNKLNDEFVIEAYGKDASFSRFLPQAYNSRFDWKAEFEEGFTHYFNGLMIRGLQTVGRVHLAVFPTEDVLERFIKESDPGDLLFMHHPIVMECGDPEGEWGRGFVPIHSRYIKRIKEKQLSVYTCHIPMDFHESLGTSMAILKAMKGKVIDGLLQNERGENLILISEIATISTNGLIEQLKGIFEVPYLDVEGKQHREINRVAIVAGCGDKVDWMKQAEAKGVQAYISGEIHCHIDNEYGRLRYHQMMEYAEETTMSLLGVSHSASEYLVKRTLIKDWFEKVLGIETNLLPQKKWWL
ncbi:Nif3-like dinuclear metal center hexameric protein [Rossellomorea aquimaris]|uniref:Nif3-like dinuclear metal center hexameric protein n=1 Tax=Rossellomorea aquimaris TaxID=189382 RepID=UPI001CD6736E|nr:Nif3-like dinuclear metal center hexameric protein [Rossellomorea aquimaris]MCA1053766.1 Nif3-like dinuclear metal center hexameric protein [Rossellomorea aquimaris]